MDVGGVHAYENAGLEKHEFHEGEVFARPCPPPAHNFFTARVLARLGRGGFDSNQRIYIPGTGLYTYADGGVVRGTPEVHSDGMCLLNPVLLLEVLSPSTREYDTGWKRQH